MNFAAIFDGFLILIIGLVCVAALVGAVRLAIRVFSSMMHDTFSERHRHDVFIALQDQITVKLHNTRDQHARSILASGLMVLRTMHIEGKRVEEMIIHTLHLWREVSRLELLNKKERSNGQAQG